MNSQFPSYLLFALVIPVIMLTSNLSHVKRHALMVSDPTVSPSYIWGQDSLDKFLEDQIDYYNVLADEGEVTIGFVVEKDGTSHSMHMEDTTSNDIALEAARVLSLINKWSPAKKRRKVVRSIHHVKVKFKRPTDHKLPDIEPINASSVYDGIGDLQPEFPGGPNAFGQFLSETVVYPELALERNVQGKVFVKFIVQKDGTIGKVEILRGIGHGCDLEALRIMSLSPLWQPGFQEGIALNVWFTMPITFGLR